MSRKNKTEVGILGVVKKYLLITGRYFFTFYTFRALGLHILFLLGYVPNTWLIALVVLGVSQFFLFIYPCYWTLYVMSPRVRLFEIIVHLFPVVFLPWQVEVGSVFLLIGSLLLYFLVHGPRRVFHIYRYKYETECELRKVDKF